MATPNPTPSRLDSVLECDGASLMVGFYHPSDSFRRMGEHICVMDVSRDLSGDGGELIALFGPSRCAGATAEEEARSEAQARLFIASVRMLASLNRILAAFEFGDMSDLLSEMPGAIAEARRAVESATLIPISQEAN